MAVSCSYYHEERDVPEFVEEMVAGGFGPRQAICDSTHGLLYGLTIGDTQVDQPYMTAERLNAFPKFSYEMIMKAIHLLSTP